MLNQIADQPSSNHVFQVNQFRDLENIIYQVAGAACSPDITPRPIVYPTPPPTQPTSPCEQEDIVFLVDASGSIQYQNWPIIKNFIRNVVNDFDVGPRKVQVGIATFGDNVNLEFHLNRYYTKADVLQHINQMRYLDQTTNTPAAIRYTTLLTFNNSCSIFRKMCFYLSLFN